MCGGKTVPLTGKKMPSRSASAPSHTKKHRMQGEILKRGAGTGLAKAGDKL
jgi:hypothetical protein